MNKVQSSLAVEINNQTIAYVPNTLEYDDGKGEEVIVNESLGNGNVQCNYAENDETKIGKVKFQLLSKPENVELKNAWKALKGANSITLSDSTSGFSISFAGMTMINNPSIPVSNDAKFEVEFQGNPAI